ncbi:hypothetical protein TREMEDRAFT_27029, partial [Tremella mesenterica DSM 1558]|uniref:uncharacterized protein n=1 Tax=Tremella mesenterica (strain ATCC 24925 / CBS 8224 / DSM 1558 / NBRC 9311 / NRRL Y-6157 / RJB 2259-6 / UBC 559-6) TaxID=578456 RepID=UPI0003F4A63A
MDVDIAGPFGPAIKGERYFFVGVERASRIVFAVPITTKNESSDIVRQCISKLEKQLGERVRVIRSDGGGEFDSLDMREFYLSAGINHYITPRYTPELNGVAERMIRTLKGMVSTMLFDSGLPNEYWSYAVRYAAIIIMKTSIGVSGKSGWTSLTGRDTNLDSVWRFGERCFVQIPREIRLKSNFTIPRGSSAIILGQDEGVSGWIVRMDGLGRIEHSRDVRRSTGRMVATRESPDVIQTPLDAIEVDLDPVVNEEIFPDDRSESGEQENIDNEQGNDVDRDNSPNTGPQPTERRRGQGIWGGNWIYENDIVENERNDEEGRNDGDEGILTTRIESDTSLIDPISPEEAVNGPDGEKWLESMEKEISNIESKETWVETVLPPGRKAIGCKWVFKVKTDSEGNLLKYKSRLVAQGFSQVPGVDYEETFAPVGRSGSLRILLTIAATEDLEIRQADVEGAYLNGKLDVEIYMKYPKGIKPKPGCNTLKLVESLYGLKQSGRTWWIELGEGLSHLGFSRIESDWGLYYRPEGKIEGKGAAILLAYVDDLVLATKSKEEAKEIFDGLGKRWIITDLGEISTILGGKVTRNREEKTIWLNQPAYIDKIVQKFPENDLHRDRKTPLPLTAKNPSMSEVESEIRPFQELIGCLQWLATCTRPDISYAASYLARYLTKPTKKVWE